MDLNPLLPRKLAKLVSKSIKVLFGASSIGEFVFVRALGVQKHSTLASIHILDRAVLLLLCAARGANKQDSIPLASLESTVTDTSGFVATGITLWFNSGQALVKKGFHLNNLFLNCVNIILGYTETSQSLSQGMVMIKNGIYSQISWYELSYGLACFVVIQRVTVANTHKLSLKLIWDSIVFEQQAEATGQHQHPNPELKAQLQALATLVNTTLSPASYQIKITETVHRDIEFLTSGNSEPLVLSDAYTTNRVRFGTITPQQYVNTPDLSVFIAQLPTNNTDILQLICDYRRYQSASYGRSFLHYSGLATNVLRQHEHSSFAEYVGIPVDDIISSSYSSGYSLYRFSSSPLIYFLSVDRSARTIVVSLRGTFDLQDVFTDVMFHYKRFSCNGKEYRAHCGMLRSARLVLKSALMDQLISTMETYEDYSLVVLGHSLGAGVAALVSILISCERNNEFVTSGEYGIPPNREIKCIAYAPPATVNLDLSDQVEGLVVSVIYSDDAVPHLSLGVLWDLKAITLELHQQKYQFFKLLKYLNGPQGNLEHLDSMVERLRQKMTSEKLVPPGKIYRIDEINKQGSSFDQIPKRVVVSQITNKRIYFNEPIFSMRMFHHTSNYYEKSLDVFASSLPHILATPSSASANTGTLSDLSLIQ